MSDPFDYEDDLSQTVTQGTLDPVGFLTNTPIPARTVQMKLGMRLVAKRGRFSRWSDMPIMTVKLIAKDTGQTVTSMVLTLQTLSPTAPKTPCDISTSIDFAVPVMPKGLHTLTLDVVYQLVVLPGTYAALGVGAGLAIDGVPVWSKTYEPQKPGTFRVSESIELLGI